MSTVTVTGDNITSEIYGCNMPVLINFWSSYNQEKKTTAALEQMSSELQDIAKIVRVNVNDEPDIAYPYIFNRFKGEEWRTQKTVAELLARHFTTKPDGIPGNDDAGTMSAWAVFSMMGLYPDTPGEPYYSLTAPAFEEVEIDTPQGTLKIAREGEGYIKRIKLNDKPYAKFRVGHDELIDAGTLLFELEKR